MSLETSELAHIRRDQFDFCMRNCIPFSCGSGYEYALRKGVSLNEKPDEVIQILRKQIHIVRTGPLIYAVATRDLKGGQLETWGKTVKEIGFVYLPNLLNRHKFPLTTSSGISIEPVSPWILRSNRLTDFSGFTQRADRWSRGSMFFNGKWIEISQRIQTEKAAQSLCL